ncbi:MAG: S41 family peptidase [bacterium]
MIYLDTKWKWLFGILVILLVAGSIFAYRLGFYLGQSNAQLSLSSLGAVVQMEKFAQQGQEITDLDFNLFSQVWNLIKTEYIGRHELTDQQLFYGALQGLVAATGDPYSAFLDPEVFSEFKIDLTGTFEGIGAEIGMKDEIITVVAPLADRPADIAGLRAGDQIIKIDDQVTFGLTVMEAVKKIRGPQNTIVTLTVARAGQDQPLVISITRSVIIVESVKTSWQDDIFIIQISNFAEDTDWLFSQAVNEALLKNPQGIIVDLRNNPGGFFQSAINMASEWVGQGVVVSEKFNSDLQKEYQSNGRNRLSVYPTVVLVNEGSASASEIVAGALHDHEKATIVGQQTFGKGTVQSLHELTDGSAVKITNAKWLTPDGYDMSEAGIIPDIVVEYTADDWQAGKDPQLDKALEILKK